MSWKSVETEMAGPDMSGPTTYHWSISTRLITLHIMTVLLSLIVCAGIMFVLMNKHVNEENGKGLREQANAVKTVLRLPNGSDLLAQEIAIQKFEANSIRPLIRTLDGDGQVLQESPRMDRILPVAAFPVPEGGDTHVREKALHGGTYLLKAYPLGAGANSGPERILQIAVDISDDVRLMDYVKTVLVALVIAGTLFALLSGLLVTRQSLKSLSDISDTARNISERYLHKRIETANLPVELVSLSTSFNNMLERLEDSFTRLTQYTTHLAHELRAPISNLMIEADVALSRTRSIEEYQAVIGSSLEEYQRLSSIIGRLLFLARAENCQQHLNFRELDVRREIEQIAELYSTLSKTKEITLTVDGQAVLDADPELLRLAVTNLVDNAFNYTLSGGRIAVTIRQAEDRSVEVVISDTGCGIGTEHLSKIFDRFYRVNDTRKNDADGSGLGLSIVTAIMKLHGGTVSVQSRPGEGTRFSLMFPSNSQAEKIM
jgi:two-component system heavy metal sensor histidine kinase CusS